MKLNMLHRYWLAAVVLMASTLPSNAEVIANSEEAFAAHDGEHGNEGWSYGYRNVEADDDRTNYSSDDFIAFSEDDGWVWDGAAWDWGDGNVPWTLINASGGHPNGTNNGEEHWAIRRWTSDTTAPLAVSWHLHKNNTNGGNGTAVSVHLNGAQIDYGAVEGTDGDGIDQTVFVYVTEGDVLDFALRPEGPVAEGEEPNPNDGSDGSAWWAMIDNTIPADAEFVNQPFQDTDGDTIGDAVEESYFPGDLDQLSENGDFDNDGVTDSVEVNELKTDPTNDDTDGDGLKDGVETGTGTFVNAEDTGTRPTSDDSDGDGLKDNDELTAERPTDPTKEDTDGDGFTDGLEVSRGFDPSNPNDNPNVGVIASSIEQWSADGEQGSDGWFYGYRNATADGKGNHYDAETDFIQFEDGVDGWIWDGSKWDWADGDVPWTEVANEVTHPNGDNNGDVHWTVRRWVADVENDNTLVALTWHIRKNNVNCGNGVAGSLHLNGRQLDFAPIAGNDGEGIERTFYATVNQGDNIDLALTPEGPDESNGDGCDGSSFWLVVNSRVPDPAFQPDGSIVIPPAPYRDSDNDQLYDGWEEFYADGSLETFTGNGDFDEDNVTDLAEQQQFSDPTKKDTDGDGLGDGVETNTGTFVDADNAGSDPNVSDTDGDGVSDFSEVTENATDPNNPNTDGDASTDGEELACGTDPNDSSKDCTTGQIANSELDWSRDGIQGEKSWFYGYRNLSAENDSVDEIDYDPLAHFIQYPTSGDLNWWTGTTWDFPDGNVPWTSHGPVATHPNGDNNGEVHWTIRRWEANVGAPTCVQITWTTSKANTNCGNGVTGAVHHNGVRIDGIAIESNDGTGVERIVYANVEPGDFIDLINSPMGPDETNNDGCDGTNNSMSISNIIPENPVQPDGTPHICVVPPDPGLGFRRTSPFGQLGDALGVQRRTVTLRNVGESRDLVITSAAINGRDAANYSANIEVPITLAPQQSLDIAVTFNPEGRDGGFLATLDFESNDENQALRQLDLSANIPDRNNLIAWYKMDETDGTQLFDSSGNGHHGEYLVTGDGSFTLGQAGATAGSTGVAFAAPSDADAGYAAVRNFPAFEGSFLLSMWAKADEGLGAVAGLLSKSVGGQTGDPYALAAAGGVLNWFGGGSPEIEGSDSPFGDDTFKHFAVAYVSPEDGGPVIRIYVDGQLTEESSEVSEINDQRAEFQIASVTSRFGFSGVIDDVQMYGRFFEDEAEQVQWLLDNPGEKLPSAAPPVGPEAPVLGEVIQNADGSIGISILSGQSLRVEYSTDLLNWTEIATGQSGTYNDTDAARLANPEGYYRLSQ